MIKFKSTVSALAMLVAGAFSANASEMAYSFADSDQLFQWGAKLSQTYDVAVKLTGTGFTGCKITSVVIPVVSTNNIRDYSVWLSSELKLETVDGKKVNVPDIASVNVSPVDVQECVGSVVCTFAEPYEVGPEGVYVGYSFTVIATSSDFDRYPVLVAEGAKTDGFFVHSSKTYRQWQDRSAEIGCVSPIRVNLEGDFKSESVSIAPLGDFAVQAGEENTRMITIYNLGSSPVASIQYSLTMNGSVSTGEYVFPQPVDAVYNRSAQASITIPAVPEGEYSYSFAVTAVNHQPNGTSAVCEGTIRAFEVLPVKRPVMEEFTGTWCGWCPRGWVAMEMMSEMYPDDFVCISYHDSDAMQLATGYPKIVRGFPGAVLDRTLNVDPYYGSSDTEFGIRKDWLGLCQQFTPAALSLSAEYNAASNTVSVTSDVFWADASEDGEYRVEYVLTGSGIYNENLKQHNYYATNNPANYGPELGQFCAGGIYGSSDVAIPFNDVALLTSGLYGVEGSVASTLPGSHNYNTFVFKLSESAISVLAKEFNVVAMLIKKNLGYGTVINSAKCSIEGLSGIDGINADANAVSVKYYDLSGRELTAPRGLCIKQQRMSDGTVITTKIRR